MIVLVLIGNADKAILEALMRHLEEAYDKQVRVKSAKSEGIIKGIEEWLKRQRETR